MTAARTIWHHEPNGCDHQELVVVISLRTPNPLNGAQGRHWSKRAKVRKAQRTATWLVMTGHIRTAGVTPPCSVLLTRYGPSNGLDDDGLTAALKSVRDGVADALGIDDRDPRVTWSYSQRREPGWGVEVRIGRASCLPARAPMA